MTTTADGCKLIGGGHFVGHLGYHSCMHGPIFKLEPEFDRSNPYMKFGRYKIKNISFRVTTTVYGYKLIGGSHLSAILVIVC